MLPPARYNELEREAEAQLPNRLIAACKPTLFQAINYPTHTLNPKTLWRWADVMHECRFEQDFGKLLGGGITLAEWELWQIVSKVVIGLTTEMEHPIVPRGGLCRATYAFRAIQERAKPPACIVEIGPGSGYLSALLSLSGYTVVAVENTQAFYLWQHVLFERLQEGRNFIELCSRAQADAPWVDEWHPAWLHHVPWWRFYRVDSTTLEFQRVAVVAANSVICEMSPESLAYLGRLCGIWTNRPDPASLVIDNVGLNLSDSFKYVDDILNRNQVRNWVEIEKAPVFPPDRSIDLRTVVSWQQSALGQPELQTDDERWLRAAWGEDYYS